MFWDLLKVLLRVGEIDATTPKAKLVLAGMEFDIGTTEFLTALRGVLVELSATDKVGVGFTVAVKAIDEILAPAA